MIAFSHGMDLDQIKSEKAKLEDQIAELSRSFEIKTGVQIVGVLFDHSVLATWGETCRKPKVCGCKIKIEI